MLGILAAVMLVGCASPYQARGFTGGFSEVQLEQNVYEVSFVHNDMTSEEMAQSLLLRRCAELALESGGRYFEILDRPGGGRPRGGLDRRKVQAVTVRFAEGPGPRASDAAKVVRETDGAAKGALSPRARWRLDEILAAAP